MKIKKVKIEKKNTIAESKVNLTWTSNGPCKYLHRIQRKLQTLCQPEMVAKRE
jgi:hypothetical protein